MRSILDDSTILPYLIVKVKRNGFRSRFTVYSFSLCKRDRVQNCSSTEPLIAHLLLTLANGLAHFWLALRFHSSCEVAYSRRSDYIFPFGPACSLYGVKRLLSNFPRYSPMPEVHRYSRFPLLPARMLAKGGQIRPPWHFHTQRTPTGLDASGQVGIPPPTFHGCTPP